MNQPGIYMCSPSQSPLPPLSPSHPSGSSQCTSPEHLSHASNLDWWSFSHLIICMFQCYSLRSSHPRLLPKSKICSRHVSYLRFLKNKYKPGFPWDSVYWLTFPLCMGLSFVCLKFVHLDVSNDGQVGRWWASLEIIFPYHQDWFSWEFSQLLWLMMQGLNSVHPAIELLS